MTPELLDAVLAKKQIVLEDWFKVFFFLIVVVPVSSNALLILDKICHQTLISCQFEF